MRFQKDDLDAATSFLSEAMSEGFRFVSYPRERTLYSGDEFYCFHKLEDAQEHAAINGDWYSEPIAPLLKSMERALDKAHLPEIVETGYYYYLNHQKDMNRNSLENFRTEAHTLKVPEKMITAAESMMEQGVERFAIRGQIPADKGMMDLTIHMKKSGQSDYYYFNKFDVAHSKAKPLEKEHQYMVITPDDKGKNLIRKFDSPVQAMDFFREQTKKSELATGKVTDKDLQYRDTLATMNGGKIDYVKKEFQQTFYSPVLRNSHYIDRGKGYSVEQAANMLQGRSAYRDDLVSRAGDQYKAWSVYQFDQAKDKYGNYAVKQFGEGYGFDLKKELSTYGIKEMDKKETAEKLITEIQNGNRPIATVIGLDGEDKKLRIEAVPRYTNINFYELSGKPAKREDFRKEQDLGNNLSKDKSKSKTKEQENELTL